MGNNLGEPGLEVWSGANNGKLLAERETVMIAALAKLLNKFILDVVGLLFGWVEGLAEDIF